MVTAVHFDFLTPLGSVLHLLNKRKIICPPRQRIFSRGGKKIFADIASKPPMDSLPFKAKAGGGGITPPCVRQYGISTEAQGETSVFDSKTEVPPEENAAREKTLAEEKAAREKSLAEENYSKHRPALILEFVP